MSCLPVRAEILELDGVDGIKVWIATSNGEAQDERPTNETRVRLLMSGETQPEGHGGGRRGGRLGPNSWGFVVCVDGSRLVCIVYLSVLV